MAFIKDQQAVVEFGQGLHANRGQHQVVVGHDHLCLRQAAACLVVTAVPVARAVTGRTGVALGGHGGPVLGFGLLRQIVPVAVPVPARQCDGQGCVQRVTSRLRVITPELVAKSSGWRGGIVVWAEQLVLCALSGATAHAVELELAHIAATALGQRKYKWGLQHCRQSGQVFGHQLLLQSHRGRGDDQSGLERQRQRHHGGPVGGRLANAGAGLDHTDRPNRVRVLTQSDGAHGAGNSLGHGLLARAQAKTRRAGQHLLKSDKRRLGQLMRGQGRRPGWARV